MASANEAVWKWLAYLLCNAEAWQSSSAMPSIVAWRTGRWLAAKWLNWRRRRNGNG
jgi:hypothetical protein